MSSYCLKLLIKGGGSILKAQMNNFCAASLQEILDYVEVTRYQTIVGALRLHFDNNLSTSIMFYQCFISFGIFIIQYHLL